MQGTFGNFRTPDFFFCPERTSMIVLGVIMIVMVIASMIVNHYLTLQFKNNPLFRPVFYEAEV